MRRRLGPLVAALLMLSLGGAALADPQPLRWGADMSSNVPYAFHDLTDHARLVGFEAEIISAVARELRRPAVFVQNDWDNLVPGLDRGLYDVVIDGLEITPEHSQQVEFSRPYFTGYEQLVVRRSTQGLDSLAALAGHRVGTLRASLASRMLEPLHAITTVPYDSEVDAYADLQNGRIDGVLLDNPIAEYYAAPNPALALVGKPIGTLEYGIAARKGQTQLRDQIDVALATLEKSGELRRILERWKLWTPPPGEQGTPAATAVEYDRFIAETAPLMSWTKTLARYAGFVPRILWAALVTLTISTAAMSLAIVLGLCLAVLRRYVGGVTGALATGFVELIRGTPLLIQLLFIFYGLPRIGVRLDPFVAGVLALGLNYAAYEAENYRAGLEAIPAGQAEAATALNMTELQAIRYVIVPQAFRVVLPVMTNDFISLLKDSSLVSVITLTELTQTYIQLSTTYYDYLGTGVLVGAAYLLLGLPFVRLARWLERRLVT